MNKLQPLIKWGGGKNNEIKHFRKYYPSDYKVYIEPFVGGGSVFFDLEFNTNVISDVHPELINFYQQIQKGNALEIHGLVSNWKPDKKTYYYIRDEYIPNDELEKAAVFYYIRKTCFRGMLRYNKAGKFNIPFGYYDKINIDSMRSPERYEKIFKNSIIGCIGFQEIFDIFNSTDNFVFLDPPYDSTFTDYGYCQFNQKDHIELANLFKTTKNKCLLIIGKTDFIYELYKDYIIDQYFKRYQFKIYADRINKNIDNYHLVIANYQPPDRFFKKLFGE